MKKKTYGWTFGVLVACVPLVFGEWNDAREALDKAKANTKDTVTVEADKVSASTEAKKLTGDGVSGVNIKEVEVESDRTFGGGLGLANSAPFVAQMNAQNIVKNACNTLGGVLKKNSLSVSAPECGDVYKVLGFKGRDCYASAKAVCLVIEQ